jgi:uncharacterized protein YndB with AHSA1/START domain
MTQIAPVEVTVCITAAPQEVFAYFTDPARYVQWMGSEAKLEPEPGGLYRVHMPDGFQAAGTFLQVQPPHLVAFTWGFADEKAAKHVKHEQAGAYGSDTMPAGSTRVTVTLQDAGGDTLLTLRHDDLPTSELRDAHRIAWQTYLTRLAVRASGADPGADPHAATPSDALPLILWTGAVGYIRFHIYVDRPMVLAVFEQRVSGILVTWRLRTRAGR